MGLPEMKQVTRESKLLICLLGRFEVRVGDTVVIDRSWTRSRAKSLVKLLALQGGRPLHREQVLDVLWPDLDAAAEGRGTTLFVAGPAGIGKSRFAQQILAMAEEAGGLVLAGRSYPLEASVAYQPLREVLRQLVEGVAEEAPRKAIEGSLYLKRLLPESTKLSSNCGMAP